MEEFYGGSWGGIAGKNKLIAAHLRARNWIFFLCSWWTDNNHTWAGKLISCSFAGWEATECYRHLQQPRDNIYRISKLSEKYLAIKHVPSGISQAQLAKNNPEWL